MSIKKVYEELYSVLSENTDKKVKDLMPILMELMESKTRDKNSYIDTDTGHLMVYCYYHKEWEDTTVIPYGSKKNTLTGLNSMCKVGVNAWTKQQRDFKKAKAELIDKVVDGEIEATDLNEEIAKLEADRDAIVPYPQEAEDEAA